MRYWFTADEHYGHSNIIKYCNRPFSSIEEMDTEIIKRHNSVITKEDVVIHAGDFSWGNATIAKAYIKQLNGMAHIFLRGSHDHWLPASTHEIWSKRIEGQLVVVCHYPMIKWEASHYGSWQLFGHCHGRLWPHIAPYKQHDIGVDNNNFYPVSFEQIKEIMLLKLSDPNQIKTKET